MAIPTRKGLKVPEVCENKLVFSVILWSLIFFYCHQPTRNSHLDKWPYTCVVNNLMCLIYYMRFPAACTSDIAYEKGYLSMVIVYRLMSVENN